MLVDALLQHEVEGQVNKMVEKVRGQEIKQEVVGMANGLAEVAKEVVKMAKKVIRVVKEVVKATEQMVVEFIACNPKEYDGKGGARVYTHWIEKIESVQDISGCGENQKTRGREAAVGITWEDFKTLAREELCPNNEMQKLETVFWCQAMVEAGHDAYTNRFNELARLFPHLVTLENKRNERNEALKKIFKKRANNKEPSRDGNARDDNKIYRMRRAFATTTNPVRMEYTSNEPKCTKACFECGGMEHYKEACHRLNRALRPQGNHQNHVMVGEGRQVCGKNGNQAHGRAFMMGAGDAHQDPNIVMGTFTLDNHYATTLFDFGADYSFVSTTFMTLLDIEPNNFGFSYEIKIASSQLVEINEIIRGCKLKIKGCIFDIDLISFEYSSFNMIVGMDWLSRHKAESFCYEKIVRIPLPNEKNTQSLIRTTRRKGETF
uniref:Reverse transcriptase domain-containing protein n=1 Tax=Tanacetum cinerariifolium TaxID=118510 RepID=A0A699I8M1_TANCI|nr:hypothetical protein [Tanacetum cinerariifolium]GEZ33883.1 hypothetical protein [Tanacetum cinerariifolium]